MLTEGVANPLREAQRKLETVNLNEEEKAELYLALRKKQRICVSSIHLHNTDISVASCEDDLRKQAAAQIAIVDVHWECRNGDDIFGFVLRQPWMRVQKFEIVDLFGAL